MQHLLIPMPAILLKKNSDKGEAMRLVIQRVLQGSVSAAGKITGEIGKGLMVFVGVCDTDTEQITEKIVRKLLHLRIFEDAEGKTNLSLQDVEGGLLIVSQFTLYADCKKGNRPSFVRAGKPEHANALYEYFLSLCAVECSCVQHGIFGADMKVSLVNDGPFTIVLDSEEILK